MPDLPITNAFIAALPKTDLHVHLDGSLRIPTLIELAREQRVELPSYTEGGLRETVYKERYTSLGDYLKGFRYTVAVMQSAEHLERIAAELAEDNQAEGVTESLSEVLKAGIDPLWFGIFVVLVVEMAQITPPVGFNLFVLQGMTGREIGWIARVTLPFFFCMAAAIVLVTVFPSIITALPKMLMSR